MLLTFPPPAEKDPAAAAVVAELNAKKLDPTGYVLYSYATLQVWAEAATKAGSTKPAVVAKELKSGGPVAFGSRPDRVRFQRRRGKRRLRRLQIPRWQLQRLRFEAVKIFLNQNKKPRSNPGLF